MKLFLLLLLLPLLVSISGCDSMCANQILHEIPSPNKELKAVVFQRDCGATTGFSTQVSILKAYEMLQNTKGDVFSADTNHGKVPSGPCGGPMVEVAWKAPLQLEIKYPENVRVFLTAKEIKVSTGIFKSEVIQITYSPVK